MITKGLGTNSLFTIGYNKTQVIVLFIKNNFKIFIVQARFIQFTIKERLVDFLLNSRPVGYFLKTERLVRFVSILRTNMFNLPFRTTTLIPTLSKNVLNPPQRTSEITTSPNNTVMKNEISLKTFKQIRKTAIKGKLK